MSEFQARSGKNRPSFQSIYLVGPSSSGKSTLCDALERALTDLRREEVVVIKEVARTVMAATGFTRDDVGRLAMQEAIMHAQLRAELAARASNPGAVLISDRSAIDPVAYARLFDARSPGNAGDVVALTQQTEFQRLLPIYRKSLFVLLRPVQEWIVDDGVRSMEDQWPSYQMFKEVLQELGIRFHEVGDEVLDLDVRVELVLKWAGAAN